MDQQPAFNDNYLHLLRTITHCTSWQQASLTGKVDIAKLAETTYQREKDAQEKLLQLIAVNKQQLDEGLDRHNTVFGKYPEDCDNLNDQKIEVDVEQNDELEPFMDRIQTEQAAIAAK